MMTSTVIATAPPMNAAPHRKDRKDEYWIHFTFGMCNQSPKRIGDMLVVDYWFADSRFI